MLFFIANIRLTEPFGGKFVKWILTGTLIISEYFTPFIYIRVVSRGTSLVVMNLFQSIITHLETPNFKYIYLLSNTFFLWLNNL